MGARVSSALRIVHVDYETQERTIKESGYFAGRGGRHQWRSAGRVELSTVASLLLRRW